MKVYDTNVIFRWLNILEPCEYIQYTADTLSYDKYTTVSIFPEDQNTSNVLSENQTIEEDESKAIIFYYSSTEVDVYTTDLLVNFSNFVSSVGGNLGMFIGFSFLGCFSGLYDMIKRVCSKVQTN